MTFQDFLIQGFIGRYCNEHLSGTAYAVVTGIALLLCMLTYFVGSLNFSIIISKYFYHDDIRKYGSGNAGTTNMLRTYGTRAAALTLAGDALKAVVSSLFGYLLLGFTGAYMAGFFCILGHIFPIYYHFKGGKGIVTVAFMVLMLDPVVFAILLAIFILLVAASKMVSFGSVMCVLIYPMVLYQIEGPGIPIIFAFMIMVLVLFMHRENIMRIYRGEESKLDFAKLFGRKKQHKIDEDVSEEEHAPAETSAGTSKKPHAVSADKKKRRKKQQKNNRSGDN